MNYLIGYKDAERNFGHEDPMLTEYTYGESGANTDKLQKYKREIFYSFIKQYITSAI